MNRSHPAPDPASTVTTETDSRDPNEVHDPHEVHEGNEETLRLTPAWIAVGVVAVALGIAMGFIMSSVWLVR